MRWSIAGTGCWLLVAGCWLLVTGRTLQQLATSNQQPATSNQQQQPLEREPRRDLHRPRIACETRDRAERRRGRRIAVRQAEVDGVEHVEDVPAQRDPESRVRANRPLYREVQILEARAVEAIALLVAE